MELTKLEELIELKNNIQSAIAEELSQYDLYEHDLEFDRFVPISFDSYPLPLQDFLETAWSELDDIEAQIKRIKNHESTTI